MTTHTPADDAGEVERAWFVQIESCLINGEDDVMSPEPPEVIWAKSADHAHYLLASRRDYDTNLLIARPASEAEARAEADNLRAKLGKVAEVLPRCENFVNDWDCARGGRDIDSPYGATGYCLPCKLRPVLSADPVSLADVRAVNKARALEALMMHRLVGPRYRPLGTSGLSHTYPYSNGDWACACGAGGPDGYRAHMQHVANELINAEAVSDRG